MGCFANCCFSAPVNFKLSFSEISLAISSCTTNTSASLRLYCCPQISLLSCALISSTLIETASPRCVILPVSTACTFKSFATAWASVFFPL